MNHPRPARGYRPHNPRMGRSVARRAWVLSGQYRVPLGGTPCRDHAALLACAFGVNGRGIGRRKQYPLRTRLYQNRRNRLTGVVPRHRRAYAGRPHSMSGYFRTPFAWRIA